MSRRQFFRLHPPQRSSGPYIFYVLDVGLHGGVQSRAGLAPSNEEIPNKFPALSSL
jgi:hypothetical protein